jgi:N-acetylneuraminic acid mutarotase
MKSRLLVLLSLASLAALACSDVTEPNLVPTQQLAPQAAALSWVTTASMSTARQLQGTATGANGLIYMISGTDANGSPIAGSEAYNPANNSWASIAHPGAWCCGGTARGLDGKIYIAGGENDVDGVTSAVKVYDPTVNTWSSVAPLSIARDVMTLVTDTSGKLYAIGGAANGMSNRLVSTVEIFDPVSGTWTGGAAMGTPRWYHASALGSNGKIYVFGGMSGFTSISSAEVYDPVANTWSPISSMPEIRYGHAAVTGGDGRIYIVGGYVGNDGGTGKSVLVYDPQTDTWESAPDLNVARTQHGATLGLDKKIYVAGGSPPNSSAVTNSAESFATVLDVPTNHPPVALAGADQTLECSGGGATAHLNGSASSDPDSDPLTFAWLDGVTSLGTTATIDPRLGVGVHPITLRVTDSKQASAEDGVTVTVKDSRAPSIHVQRFDQFVFKMPEGGYKLVAWVKATDDCQADPTLAISVVRTRIFGHEYDAWDDRDTAEPKVVPGKSGGYEVYLPATHDFFHTSVYTIKSVATDAAGNSASVQTYVTAIVIPSFNLPFGKLRFGR